MIQPFPKKETRQALVEALPENDQASSSPSDVAYTYVPPSHARALDPENTLVEGIRGAGKSFWWAALNSPRHRRYVASVFPEARISDSVETSQGFGPHLPTSSAPSKDTLKQLTESESWDPRHIWRAVVATQIGFQTPFPTGKWPEKVRWVTENPEDYDEMLYRADEDLRASGKKRLLLFDALDRLADDWPSIRPLARALLQAALDLRASHSIRAKVFIRPDMLEDREVLAFPDSSKLLARKVALTWRRVDLYALLFQCLGNAETSGEVFREHCHKAFNLAWKQDEASDAWIVPHNLRTDENKQREVFHAIAGPAMASGPSGHKRGYPYTWLPNHLLDGRDQVSPRSFCAALRRAATHENPEDWPYPLHYKAIQAGVQEASSIRVHEITREDYPWVKQVMDPLSGRITVPCAPEEILSVWHKEWSIEGLRHQAQKGTEVKLPPQHLDEGPGGILKDLEGLGLIQRLRDGRIQMPDVYRIAFGLGRKGGVKPLK